MSGAAGGRFATLAGSVVVGVAVGAFTAVTWGVQVGVALGIVIGYVAFLAMIGVRLARDGVDVEALKARFYPSVTIDTSKETLEWLQRRMPPGTGS